MEPARICRNCQHGLAVVDNRAWNDRWVCLEYDRVIDDPTFQNMGHCFAFEPKVPQVPYIPREQAQRMLDVMLVQEIRSALLNVENLLKALELQPQPNFR